MMYELAPVTLKAAVSGVPKFAQSVELRPHFFLFFETFKTTVSNMRKPASVAHVTPPDCFPVATRHTGHSWLLGQVLVAHGSAGRAGNRRR